MRRAIFFRIKIWFLKLITWGLVFQPLDWALPMRLVWHRPQWAGRAAVLELGILCFSFTAGRLSYRQRDELGTLTDLGAVVRQENRRRRDQVRRWRKGKQR